MKREIVRLIHGSKLYGVSTKDSDTDIKSVYIVDTLRELYEGNLSNNVSTNGLLGSAREEYEEFYIKNFAKLLFSGQTVAFDMLFAPPTSWITFRPDWEILYNNRRELVSKNIAPFVKYARSQASKYSLKGLRLKTLKEVLVDLKEMQSTKLSSEIACALLRNKYKDREGIRLWVDGDRTSLPVQMIEICGKSFGETTDLKLWIPPLENLVTTFGERSEASMLHDGKDTKAMYHAVRILGQCLELLEYKTITFPRPNAEQLMLIRSGKVSLEETSELIDSGTKRMDELLLNSTLPETPDKKWLDDWAFSSQSKEIKDG